MSARRASWERRYLRALASFDQERARMKWYRMQHTKRWARWAAKLEEEGVVLYHPNGAIKRIIGVNNT